MSAEITEIHHRGFKVKQQKKSSNKWNCVICNQKQSLRKVFARGFLAKDVRKFVQGFNMSRQFPSQTLTLAEEKIQIHDYDNSHHQKKRSDWTEYLDSKDNEIEGGEEGAFSEAHIEIVTELPKDMFKKASSKCYNPSSSSSSGLKKQREGNKLFKPIFSKRKSANPILQENADSKKCKISKQVSKWSDYLEEEKDGTMLATSRDSPNTYNLWCEDGVLESGFNDQRVEEDVHPDFM
ncbi:uncharacterized protein LOC143846039 isoform X2 [Tasmannia lanceolata]|uniref:uncharacterized protein LOC143846039 isoform X2 n=1 Tax=Tasmannia lanceolata TaxID=3420 RepID=UPI004062E4AA